MRNIKPYWDKKHKAVFVPVINKLLEAKDLCEEEKNWNETIRLAEEARKELPSKNDMLVIAYFQNEINSILEENNGKKLEGQYWTSEEWSSIYAAQMNFNDTLLTLESKCIPNKVRAIKAT